MLGLTGLPMGIAAIACFGGSLPMVSSLKCLLGDNSNVAAVMMDADTGPYHNKAPHTDLLFQLLFGRLFGSGAAFLGIYQQCPGNSISHTRTAGAPPSIRR